MIGEGCPVGCGGCSCHLSPPCDHCVEHSCRSCGEFDCDCEEEELPPPIKHYHVTPAGRSSVSVYNDDGTHKHELVNQFGYSELEKEIPNGDTHCHMTCNGPTDHAVPCEEEEHKEYVPVARKRISPLVGIGLSLALATGLPMNPSFGFGRALKNKSKAKARNKARDAKLQKAARKRR